MSEARAPGDVAAPGLPAAAPIDASSPAVAPAAVEPAAQRRRITLKSPRQAIQPETAAPPPQRSQKARHPIVVVLNFFLMIIVLGVLGAGAAFYFGKLQFTRPGPLAEPANVLVARGADLDSISAQLVRQNVIDSGLIFSTAARVYGAEDKLKAGEYLFAPGVSMERVLDDLVSGRAVLHSIAFPEGLTSQQIVNRLNAELALTGKILETPAEGMLMPSTYKFTRGEDRGGILEQMRRAQERAVAEVWERRSADLPIATPEELITLASIVEKETGKADERPRVAAVFINRLRSGMRLQSDPTIIYGLFGGTGKPSGRAILQSDLDKATAYNTYQVGGLPPTPIANPGRAALEAVANPSRTEELYFVADGTGGHAFAATLEDHNRNVARWRRLEAERRQAEEAARAAAAVEPETSAEGGATAVEPAAADVPAEKPPTFGEAATP